MRPPAIATLALLALASIGFAQDACVPQRVISPADVGTDDFGLDVETNGSQWFVGAPDARTLCAGTALSCSSGAVFVYDNVDGRLVHTQTIVPPDVALYDKFGISLDVDGDRLAIGSLYTRHPTSGDRTGAVFVYEFDGVEWAEVERVWPPPSIAREFAVALELAAETMFVRPLVGSETLVYTKSEGAKWTLKQTLDFPGPPSPDAGFGGVWAVHEDWVVTGSYLDRRVAPAGGSVQIYRRQADGTIELFQEILSEPEPMYLGITLDFIDDTLVVGAPAASRDLPHQGVVQFYEFDGERWTLQNELTQTEPREDRWFGSTLIVQDHRLFVSAFNERTAVSRGLVYEFAKDAGGAWIEADRFVPDSAHYAGHYGTALASAGGHLLVGASQDETATGGLVGGAYFFDLACGDCVTDLDADGALTIFDFLAFFNMFDDGDAQADFDGDGELTIFDFLAFQTAFDAGCE